MLVLILFLVSDWTPGTSAALAMRTFSASTRKHHRCAGVSGAEGEDRTDSWKQEHSLRLPYIDHQTALTALRCCCLTPFMLTCTGMDFTAVCTLPPIHMQLHKMQDNSDAWLRGFKGQGCSVDMNSDVCYKLTRVSAGQNSAAQPGEACQDLITCGNAMCSLCSHKLNCYMKNIFIV